jgi:hypothetical protein
MGLMKMDEGYTRALYYIRYYSGRVTPATYMTAIEFGIGTVWVRSIQCHVLVHRPSRLDG